MSRSRALFAGQLILGVLLLAILLFQQELGADLLDVLADFNWRFVPILVILSGLLIGISSMKWRLFLNERGIQMPLWRLMKLYVIGTFFSNFVPTMVGGDLARSYLLGRHIDSQVRSAASVFLERFTGLIALLLLASSTIAINPQLMKEPLIRLSMGLIGGGSIVALTSILFPRPWQNLLARWSHFPPVDWLHRIATWSYENVHEIKENPGLFRVALAYSFGFHILAGLNVYVAALSIGSRPDVLKVLTLTPIVLLVASLPLTPNSLGVLEWAYSFYLVPAGLLPAAGLAVAIIIRAKSLALSILGGLLFLLQGGASIGRMEAAAREGSLLNE